MRVGEQAVKSNSMAIRKAKTGGVFFMASPYLEYRILSGRIGWFQSVCRAKCRLNGPEILEHLTMQRLCCYGQKCSNYVVLSSAEAGEVRLTR